MKLRWMFRGTELVTDYQSRGTLAVYFDTVDNRPVWRAVFDPNMGSRIEVTKPWFTFRADDSSKKQLPSPDDAECRDLGEVTILAMEDGPSDMPRPTFTVHSRLPVTGERQSTAVVSVRSPLRAKGG